PVRALRELCARYPSVAAGLLELVLKRTATLRKQLRQVGSTSTERLVSGVLFELTQVAPAGTGCYDKRISQSIIASYSGLSREQVNKTMRNLEERGLVTRDEHAVHVPGGFAPTNF
ncbi:MAG: Crp/Fnr family transcriptional regulator, partial [Burkholderiaceae bacterium]